VAEVFVNGENVARKIKEKGLDKFDNKYQQRFLKSDNLQQLTSISTAVKR